MAKYRWTPVLQEECRRCTSAPATVSTRMASDRPAWMSGSPRAISPASWTPSSPAWTCTPAGAAGHAPGAGACRGRPRRLLLPLRVPGPRRTRWGLRRGHDRTGGRVGPHRGRPSPPGPHERGHKGHGIREAVAERYRGPHQQERAFQRPRGRRARRRARRSSGVSEQGGDLWRLSVVLAVSRDGSADARGGAGARRPNPPGDGGTGAHA